MANLSSKIQGVSQAAMPVISTITPTLTWNNSDGLTVDDSGLTFQRDGEYLIINGIVTFTGSGTSGSALSLSLSGLNPQLYQTGSVRVEETTTGEAYTYLAYSNGSNIAFYPQNIGAVASVVLAGTAFGNVSSGDFHDIYFNGCIFRITEWIGQGTLQTANTYQVEYVSNSDTSDADDTTSFVTGMSGSSFPGALTATRSKRVRFAGQIQASDRILIEVNDGNGWVDLAATIFTYNLENSTAAGITYSIVNSTEVDVNFSPYARLNGATFGAAGQAWTAFSTYKYRVRKVSGGIQGFGNATTTTPGLVTLNQLCPTTEWTSYTPTYTNDTAASITTNLSRWKRDATDLLGEYRITLGGNGTDTGAFMFGLPDGKNPDLGLMSATGNTRVGNGAQYDTSIGDYRKFDVFCDTSGNLFFIDITSDTTTGSMKGTDLDSGDVFHWSIRIPIREWAGSLPGLVSDAQVEFASTSDTWDSNGSTTTFGAGGQAMGGALTGARTKTITWASNVGATDEIVVELSKDGVQWAPASTARIGPSNDYVVQSANSTISVLAGVFVHAGGSANQTVVTFAQYMAISNDQSTLTTWPSSNAYWRVKKVKSSISALVDNATATSYGLVKGGKVPGATDGAAIAAGYVGEKLTAVDLNGTISSASANTYTDAAGLSLSLTAGTWGVGYGVTVSCTSSSGNTRLALSVSGAVAGTSAWTQSSNSVSASRQTVVTLASAETLKVQLRGAATSNFVINGQDQTGSLTNPDTENILWAVRIA